MTQLKLSKVLTSGIFVKTSMSLISLNLAFRAERRCICSRAHCKWPGQLRMALMWSAAWTNDASLLKLACQWSLSALWSNSHVIFHQGWTLTLAPGCSHPWGMSACRLDLIWHFPRHKAAVCVSSSSQRDSVPWTIVCILWKLTEWPAPQNRDGNYYIGLRWMHSSQTLHPLCKIEDCL